MAMLALEHVASNALDAYTSLTTNIAQISHRCPHIGGSQSVFRPRIVCVAGIEPYIPRASFPVYGQTASESSQARQSPRCRGAEYVWAGRYILNTYPLSIHEPGSRHDPGYELLSVDVTKSVIRARSPRCLEVASAGGEGCKSCMDLGPKVDVI
ncbi:hypothetical protein B0H10DRAFT_273165 [Mycena sp. CBHHK59/15]|nr:hypothetical protein B0H10DRAFT_273165 [Mycena sp. CBHHK59/15]